MREWQLEGPRYRFAIEAISDELLLDQVRYAGEQVRRGRDCRRFARVPGDYAQDRRRFRREG